jgi:gluconolactonase
MLKQHALFTLVALIAFGCTPPPEPEPEAPPTGAVERLDPALDAIIPEDAQIEKLADGFSFIEGPLWRADGSVWFSDVVGNVVLQYAPDGTVTDVLVHRCTGATPRVSPTRP